MFEICKKYPKFTLTGILSIVSGLYLLLVYVPSQMASRPILTGILCTTQTQIQNAWDGWIPIGITLIFGGIVLFCTMLFFGGCGETVEIRNNKPLGDFMANLDKILYKGKIVCCVTNEKKYPPLRYITIRYLDKNYIFDIEDIHVQDAPSIEKDISEENN